jgi:membrane-bound lytic murein transglycosylase D
MERPVLKNFPGLLLLLASLWLAGCAAPVPAPKASAPAALPAPVSQIILAPEKPVTPGLRPPVYPSGSLRPLSAATVDAWTVHALTPPADIWDRIRRGFAMPNLRSDLVRDREQWYISRPDYIERMTERGRKYLFHVVEELEQRDMPTELALLPFIESAFNPQAVSSARAAGMWQFMPATGRTFELKQNIFRDDRRDVLASTRAALDYLQKLYGMFGDWHLALAAYNWGEGSVARAMAKNQKLGLGTRYTDLKMPMETQFYVPKLQAIKNIVANPEALRARLPLIENHPFFDTVDISRDIDVTVAAKLAEVSLEDFRALNPSASKPVLLAAGTPQILLPWANAGLFQSNLEAYTGGRLASWTAWVAPTTQKPADVAQRFGMTEDELRAVNNIPPHMLIRAGSALVVRRHNGSLTDVSNHVADHGQLSLAPDVVLRKTTVKAGKRDTVVTLAQKYRVSAASLADWNHVKLTAAFKPGQQVTLFLPAKARPVRQAKADKPKADKPKADKKKPLASKKKPLSAKQKTVANKKPARRATRR